MPLSPFDPTEEEDEPDYDPEYVGRHRMAPEQEELEMVSAAA